MSTKCKFELDQQDPLYYSGDRISGRAVLSTTKEKNIKGIVINFVGKCYVAWSHGRSSEYGEEKCANIQTQMRSQGILPIGTHYFKFSISIPENCPSSCEKKNGKIYYELSLVIQRFIYLDDDFVKKITVLQTYDLNLKPELLLPINREKTNQTSCFCLRASPIIATVNIPFGGYAPGQDIHYTLNINNQTNNSYKYKYKLKVKLIEQCDYRTGWGTWSSKTKSINTLVQTIQVLPKMATSNRSVSGSLTIPPTPISSRDSWYLMISYFIEIHIESQRNIQIRFPIEIGTKPIVLNKRNDWYSNDPHHSGSYEALQPAYR